MITVKINGKPVNFPTSWDDVTVQQYIGIMLSDSRVDVLAIFSGIDKETLLKATITNLDKVLQLLEFLKDVPTFTKTVKVGKHFLPKDITFESLAQFEDLRSLMKKIPTEADRRNNDATIAMIDLYVTACAIYCQKLRDKEYDYTKATEMKPEIYSYPCPEVIGTGAFFMARPWNLSPNTTKTSRTIRRPLKKKKRGYRT